MTPEAIKEELQCLRTVFPVLAAAVAALIAYLAQASTSASMLLLVLANAALVAGVLFMGLIIRRVYRLIRQL